MECKYILSILFFLLVGFVNGQTYIGPVLGIERTNIQPGSTHPSIEHFIPNDIGTDRTNNIKAGIRIEQYFSKQFSLTLSGTYSKIKYHRMRPDGFSGPSTLTDNSYKRQEYAVLMNYNVWNALYFGAGGSFSKHNELKGGDDIWGDNQKEYGVLFATYYRYRNFVAELRYNHGFLLKESLEDKHVFMRPTRSLSLSVSYLFQVLGPIKRNGKAMDCPTF